MNKKMEKKIEKEQFNENQTDLDLQKIPSEISDSDIDNASYKINTYGADFTLELFAQKLNSNEIVVPLFQRRYVWSEKRASKLIESFLLGLPVPQVFLYRIASTQSLLVVDGQQRLKTIQGYLNGKFDNEKRFALKAVRDKWEGKLFNQLNEADQRRIKNYILRAMIFEQVDPKDDSSVYEIFERLNTGGVTLNEQEIRNCVIQGNINKFLLNLNNDKNWRDLLKKKDPDSRMKDIEMILRFFALYSGWKKYKKPMKDFIKDFMRLNENMSDAQQDKFKKLFQNTMSKLNKNIGPVVFRLKAGINVALFDAVSVAFAITDGGKIKEIKNKIKKLKENKSFLEAINEHTTDEDKVRSRIKIAIATFSE